jgi:hypothetical protein
MSKHPLRFRVIASTPAAACGLDFGYLAILGVTHGAYSMLLPLVVFCPALLLLSWQVTRGKFDQ